MEMVVGFSLEISKFKKGGIHKTSSKLSIPSLCLRYGRHRFQLPRFNCHRFRRYYRRRLLHRHCCLYSHCRRRRRSELRSELSRQVSIFRAPTLRLLRTIDQLAIANRLLWFIKDNHKDSWLAAQREDLQRLMDLLSIKVYHARTLLIHYRWDSDKVFTAFVEKGKERLYVDAGLTIERNDDHSLSESTANMECEICFDNISVAKTTIMDCRHSL
ncbi:PREDICTED: uncharacterized protein LOC109191106 [Ipomoea nil]|uniref:uncharacterized protein LOC109191106 n=1 Tax=Ipomoea nil TaxID=35883 RepID=UPI000901F6DA|nr:PREDICTED: uncharacterized protein LOC109191106 [Ipomoea nil]